MLHFLFAAPFDMAQPDFDKNDWIARLGAALEQVAAETRPNFSFCPAFLPKPGSIELYDKELHRQYRLLAAHARHNQRASELFDRSFLSLKSPPAEAITILREHPLLSRALSCSGSRDGFHFQCLADSGHVDPESLVGRLAKSSVRFGGKRVATLLNHFLFAGEYERLPAREITHPKSRIPKKPPERLPAREITLLHGLIIDNPIDLGRGAYFASYDSVKTRFGLPDDPEPWLARSGLLLGRSNNSTFRSVLVRSLTWGPSVFPCNCPSGQNFFPTLRYRFPIDYSIDSPDRFFGDRTTLVHLLSVATRSKLVFHTVFHALPSWMRNLDPNFRLQNPGGKANIFDVWPEDQPLSDEDASTFVELTRGWLDYPSKKRHAIELATRRIVASFGPAAGMFGLEDRIFDVAIALEIMYGPFDGGEITHKLRTRAAWLLGTSPEDRWNIHKAMRTFYKARSAIVHGSTSTDRAKLEQALPLGRDLARRTLTTLLTQGPVSDWDRLVVSGSPSESTSSADK